MYEGFLKISSHCHWWQASTQLSCSTCLKMCIYSNAIGLWGNGLSINTFPIYWCAFWSTRNMRWTQKAAPTCTVLHRKTPTPQTFTSYLSPTKARSHSGPYLELQLSIWQQVTLLPPLHNNKGLQPFWLPLPQEPSGLFFKITCHIYCGIYVSPDNLICLKLVLFLCSYVFNVSLIVLGCCAPSAVIPISSGFYCVVCRNIYVSLRQSRL